MLHTGYLKLTHFTQLKFCFSLINIYHFPGFQTSPASTLSAAMSLSIGEPVYDVSSVFVFLTSSLSWILSLQTGWWRQAAGKPVGLQLRRVCWPPSCSFTLVLRGDSTFRALFLAWLLIPEPGLLSSGLLRRSKSLSSSFLLISHSPAAAPPVCSVLFPSDKWVSTFFPL